ncbi:fatty acid desaturase [Aliamphritea ceti]|uniref:fatty acid desaturase n=1 Tax=Aliamphritea ceti TaxID=1524258 RepID=UPI0021C3EC32|nr:fatty acid desaturase [Aliamphritea ceti]
MSDYQATNAASSGISVPKKNLKALMRRSDKPGLIWLAQWAAFLLITGYGVYLSIGTVWHWPAMFLYGIFLTVPSYALSHECAHGSAFRTRGLNEALLWISSVLYYEEPNHRRFAHARHHTYTWIEGKDAQMPFATPMNFKGWLLEITGWALYVYETRLFIRNALGKFDAEVLDYTPASELGKLKWGARICLAIYAALIGMAAVGIMWPLWFIIIPRLLGAPVMLLFTLIQHVEMQENDVNICKSTRSFSSNWLGRFLYMNMNFHIEHHLYPMVPFHQLESLNAEIKDQIPQPDPGFIRTNLEVLQVVWRRSMGGSTQAASIRQAPHMINTPEVQEMS